ncbi:MAG: hypothetical protein JHC84_08250 [Solirubrobacteraceae bacterium]|nr:hypothetical protein [Solirubrobacteraceae bacterium]
MPDRDPHISDDDLGALAALADGHLAPDRADALRARFATEPVLAAEFDRQRRAIDLVRNAVAEVEAPMALRERIETQRTKAPAAKVRGPRRWLLPAGIASALGATFAALLIAFGAGGAPSVADTLNAASAPAAIGVSVDRDTPQLLTLDRDGVPFPNFLAKFGWEATGARTDEIDGRQTTTVFYEKDGQEVAYTIVGGDALEVPDGDATTIDDKTFTVLEEDGRTVVTWERGGHTCVLSAEGVPADELLELAGWKGKGAVPF